MLLNIQVNPEDILKNENGNIIIRLHYYSAFSTAAWICSVNGENTEDFKNNPVKHAKKIFVGENGGISLGKS